MFSKGDMVVRYLSSEKIKAFEGPLSDEDGKFVYIGPKGTGWKFDRTHGYEVDEDIGWGLQVGGPMDGQVVSGSWIEKVES